WLEGEAKRLGDAGYAIASKQLTSTVFGGSSWLAGSSLLCGLPIANQKRFEALFASRVRCLPALFNDAGYRTVMAAPNAPYGEGASWRKMPFKNLYFREASGSRGPLRGWAYMPAQFPTDTVPRRELAPRFAAEGGHASEPLFVAYFLATSHHPWSV